MWFLIVLVTSSGKCGPCTICQLLVIHGCLSIVVASSLKVGSLLKHLTRKSLHSFDIPSGSGGQS